MKKQKKMFLQMSLAFVACFILGCNIKQDSTEPTGIPVSTITPKGMVTSIPDEKLCTEGRAVKVPNDILPDICRLLQ